MSPKHPVSRLDPTNPIVEKIANLCIKHDFHGLLFQHLAICRRRAWLHIKRIQCAHLEQRMELGQISHLLNRARDVSVEGLIGLAPDRIDWQNRIVIEAKSTAGAQEAVSYQTAFYAILLATATQESWGAQNDILSTRRVRPVHLDGQILNAILELTLELTELQNENHPPKVDRQPICNTCGYRFLCWGDIN